MQDFASLETADQTVILRRLRLIVAMLAVREVTEIPLTCNPVACPTCQVAAHCCFDKPALLAAH